MHGIGGLAVQKLVSKVAKVANFCGDGIGNLAVEVSTPRLPTGSPYNYQTHHSRALFLQELKHFALVGVRTEVS
jgi:hypothetical protein